jgi:phosphoribosylglycinamide formyltransferase 2
MEGQGIAFEGVDEAMRVPDTELRLFGKPESFLHRRMGVALAYGEDIEECRERAKRSAGMIKPVKS